MWHYNFLSITQKLRSVATDKSRLLRVHHMHRWLQKWMLLRGSSRQGLGYTDGYVRKVVKIVLLTFSLSTIQLALVTVIFLSMYSEPHLDFEIKILRNERIFPSGIVNLIQKHWKC